MGCMMSLLHLGIEITCSCSPTTQSTHFSELLGPSVTVLLSSRRPPILMSAVARSSDDISRPSILRISRSGTLCLRSSPRGVLVVRPSKPVTRTLSMAPPRSAIERQIKSKHASQARSSHPVTSMKKSVVPSLTVVWSPLMIGGNESRSSLESRMTGKPASPSIRWAYSIPLG